MLEMFTDIDHMRLDDFKFPADGGIARNKKACYNNNTVGEWPSPIKSEEIMKKLDMASIMTTMSVQHEATEATPMTIFVPKKGEIVTVRHATLGHRMVVMSIVHNFNTDSVHVQWEQPGANTLVFNSEEDMTNAKLVYEVWLKK